MKIFNLSKITTILILLSLIPGLVRVGFSQETEIKIMEEKDMDQYVGVYGPHIITLKEGNLHYQREDRPKMQMIPMKEGMFMFKEINYFRLKFIKEGNKIVAIEGTTIMETPTGMINPDKLILT